MPCTLNLPIPQSETCGNFVELKSLKGILKTVSKVGNRLEFTVDHSAFNKYLQEPRIYSTPFTPETMEIISSLIGELVIV
jgi:hypothetical protein